MMRSLTILFGIFLMVSCASKKNTSTTKQKAKTPPNWITQKPVDSECYYGIGASPISDDLSHVANAKERAISDLASDIEVTVSSNSIIYTMERTYKLDESFEEQIKVTSSQKLSNVELVAVYENQVEYWVLYKLNKQDWLNYKEAQKKLALEKSHALYKQAIAATDFKQRYTLLGQALDIVQPYWNERCLVVNGTDTLALDNAITKTLSVLVNSIKVASQNNLWLSFENNYKTTGKFKAFCPVNGNVIAASNVPFKVSFTNKEASLTSDVGGMINYPLKVADFKEQEGLVTVTPDLQVLTNNLVSCATQVLLSKITSPYFVFEWQAEPPLLYIETNTTFLPYVAALKQVLLNEGFIISLNKNEADLLISGQIESSISSENTRYKACYTSLVLAGRNKTDNIIFSYSFKEAKGMHLNEEQARTISTTQLKQHVANWDAQALLNILFK